MIRFSVSSRRPRSVDRQVDHAGACQSRDSSTATSRVGPTSPKEPFGADIG